ADCHGNFDQIASSSDSWGSGARARWQQTSLRVVDKARGENKAWIAPASRNCNSYGSSPRAANAIQQACGNLLARSLMPRRVSTRFFGSTSTPTTEWGDAFSSRWHCARLRSSQSGISPSPGSFRISRRNAPAQREARSRRMREADIAFLGRLETYPTLSHRFQNPVRWLGASRSETLGLMKRRPRPDGGASSGHGFGDQFGKRFRCAGNACVDDQLSFFGSSLRRERKLRR